MPRPAPDKTVTIRFTKRADDKTRAALFKDENGSEQVCFLFANVLETRERKVFLIDHVVTLHESCYVKRTKTSAVVHHPAKNEVYRRFVESPYDGFINVHVHAFAGLSVAFSAIDDEDDLREIAWGYAQLPRGKRACRQKTKVHLLSMVFGQKSLAARGYKPGTPPTLPTIEQVQVLGERFQIIYPTGARTPCLTAEALTTYDRQIKAFGEEGQQVLSQLHIVLVGAGGIGSVLAEGLIRLGAINLTLIDHDLLALPKRGLWVCLHPWVGLLASDLNYFCPIEMDCF